MEGCLESAAVGCTAVSTDHIRGGPASMDGAGGEGQDRGASGPPPLSGPPGVPKKVHSTLFPEDAGEPAARPLVEVGGVRKTRLECSRQVTSKLRPQDSRLSCETFPLQSGGGNSRMITVQLCPRSPGPWRP